MAARLIAVLPCRETEWDDARTRNAYGIHHVRTFLGAHDRVDLTVLVAYTGIDGPHELAVGVVPVNDRSALEIFSEIMKGHDTPTVYFRPVTISASFPIAGEYEIIVYIDKVPIGSTPYWVREL